MTMRASLFAVGLIVAASDAVAQVNPVRREIVIATATPTGNYFTTGNALCRLLQRQGLYLESGDVTLLGCGVSATSGSLQNVELLRNRDVDFALVQSDVTYRAYNGIGRFDGRRVDQLRSLLSLNQEAFQVLAGRGTNVALWADLKGKKINLGPSGTTGHTMFRELFDVHGVDDKWLGQLATIPVTTHTVELCEGNIEVLGQTTGVPNGGLASALRRCGANLVSLDTPQIRAYVAERPYYTPVFIPKDTYPGQRLSIRTFGVLATLMATSDTPDIAAYSMVRAVFEGLAELKAMQPTLANVVPEQMIADGLTAPLHPGAVRYYRERGWIKAEPVAAPVSLNVSVEALAAAAATVAPVAEPQALPAVVAPTANGFSEQPRKKKKGRGTAGPS